MSNEHDLAAIEVQEVDEQVEFHEVSQEADGDLFERMAIFGFSADLHRELSPGVYTVFAAMEWTDRADYRDAEAGSFYVNYHSAENHHPQGISGAGVWAQILGKVASGTPGLLSWECVLTIYLTGIFSAVFEERSSWTSLSPNWDSRLRDGKLECCKKNSAFFLTRNGFHADCNSSE